MARSLDSAVPAVEFLFRVVLFSEENNIYFLKCLPNIVRKITYPSLKLKYFQVTFISSLFESEQFLSNLFKHEACLF